MIGNIWSMTELLCGNNHPSPSPMTIQLHGKKLLYVCPECKNKISVPLFEKALEHISSEITEAACNNSEINLTNYHWKKGYLSFRILEHSNEKILLEGLNVEEIRK